MNSLSTLIAKIEERKLWQETRCLPRNAFLKQAGTIDTHLYLVESGCLRIFLIDDTQEHTIRFAYKQNMLVALDAFITEKPSPLYIQALKKTHIKVMGKEAYFAFLDESVENMRLWQDISLGLIYQQFEREQDLLTASPLERYRRVLERSPQLFQEVPHKYIASYLRMTPETLSRIKKS
jgi:CRP-like cAMP-binding protein